MLCLVPWRFFAVEALSLMIFSNRHHALLIVHRKRSSLRVKMVVLTMVGGAMVAAL